jgi:hypothetical protein
VGAPSRSVRRAGYVVSSLAAFYSGLGIEHPPLTNPVIEAYCRKGLAAGQASATRGTYRSVLRQLSADRRPPLAVSFPGSVAKPAYTLAERAELWQIARSQRRAWRRHSALCLIALSMGAGLPEALEREQRRGRLAGRVVTEHVGTFEVAASDSATALDVASGAGEQLGRDGWVGADPVELTLREQLLDHCFTLRLPRHGGQRRRTRDRRSRASVTTSPAERTRQSRAPMRPTIGRSC